MTAAELDAAEARAIATDPYNVSLTQETIRKLVAEVRRVAIQRDQAAAYTQRVREGLGDRFEEAKAEVARLRAEVGRLREVHASDCYMASGAGTHCDCGVGQGAEGDALSLLRKLASGKGGRRTGALMRAGYIEVRVTEAGLAALAEKETTP